MNCKKIFTRDFLSDNCTNIFITKNLKIHRENLLLDREKSLLPATQPYVVVEKERKKIDNQINETLKEQDRLKALIHEQNIQIRELSNIRRTISVEGMAAGSSETKKFIRKCPMPECRGFLSSRWKCGVCDTNICKKCNEVNDISHIECKPENIATMELINKDTKPCPKCGTMIYKLEGCDQMYCIDCHTAFSWNRGTIETGVIHNPHYYEFLRRNNNGVVPRNPGDIPCGGLPDYHSIQVILVNSRLDDVNNVLINNNLMNIHQTIAHIQHVEIRRYTVYGDQDLVNRNLRVRYLMNQLSDNDFKAILQQNEKSNQKMTDYRNICQMFCDVGSDIFRQIVNKYLDVSKQERVFRTNTLSDQQKTELCKHLYDQYTILHGLVEYFNENIKKTGKIYKCVYPGINHIYKWKSNYETYLKNIK
jgi:hypothetical protein